MAIFLGHGSRHEGAISPTLSMGYDTVPSNNESAVSEIAVSEDTMSEIAVSACSGCDRSECCHAVLSCCAVTLCALSQYSRTVCSRLCTFTLVLSPAKVPRGGTQNSAELATGAARYCQQYTDWLEQ